jgi:chloride channel 7
VKVHVFIKLIITICIGVSIGVLAVGLASVTEAVRVWKNVVTRSIIHDGQPHGILRAAIFHSGHTAALTLLASCLVSMPVLAEHLVVLQCVSLVGRHSSIPTCFLQVQFWAPAAAAAGVSLVMAYLNGVAIPQLLSLRTLIAKWVGTCCTVGANLALGPEAPMVGP